MCYIALHCNALYYFVFQYIIFYCIALQYTTIQYNIMNYVSDVAMQDEEVSYKFSLRFNADYSMYAEDQEDIVEASVYNFLLSIDDSARYHDFSISEGEII